MDQQDTKRNLFNKPANSEGRANLHQIFIMDKPGSQPLKYAEDLLKGRLVKEECLQLTLDDFSVTKPDPLSQKKNRVVIIDVNGADPYSRPIPQAVMMHMDRHAGLVFVLKGQQQAITDFLKPILELRARFPKPVQPDGVKPAGPSN